MTTYYSEYITSNAVIINTPIYSTPCRYYGNIGGCMYGDSCPFQHINYTYPTQINYNFTANTNIYQNQHNINDGAIDPSVSPSLVSDDNDDIDNDDIDNDDDNIDLKQENEKKMVESVAAYWHGTTRTIGYGSRKNMEIQKFNTPQNNEHNDNERDFALLITNCRQAQLNGLYLLSGFRNGFVKYLECINNKATIYCNPKRGWTISYDNAVYYYSYPLTYNPPTINDCIGNDNDNDNDSDIKWLYNSGLADDDCNNKHLLQIKSSSVIGYDFLDLLFVGFVRPKYKDLCWFMVSTDIIRIFCDYFIQYKKDRCSNCLRTCENVILCGFQWLCKDCNSEMF